MFFYVTVSECKEKWRNLRSTFAKNLKPKQSGTGRAGKRPYYLMEAMQFAIPFIKVAGNPSGNLPSSSSTPEGGEVDVGQEEETLSTEDLASPEIASPEIASPEIASHEIASPGICYPDIASPPPTLQDQPTPGPSTGTRGPYGYPIRKRKLGRAQGDAEQAFSEYFAAKKAKLAPKEGSSREEGIRHFLLSLMPDLVQMNDVQLRKFKRRALELVEEVCEKPVEFVPPQCYSGSAVHPYGYPAYTMLAPALPQQTPGHSHSTDEGSV